MYGIQGRLTLLFVVIVTLVLGISGTYAQYSLSHELEVNNQRLRGTDMTATPQCKVCLATWQDFRLGPGADGKIVQRERRRLQ